MERETLYLDNDEEITSVVDKLKSAESGSLDIVIPKDAMLLQSVINLKLLKKQAEGLSKDITIVTQDKVGKKLAEQIGIPVVTNPGDAPKEVKMTEDEPQLSEKDIELKEGNVTEVGDTFEPIVGQEGVVAPTAEVVKPKPAETAKTEESSGIKPPKEKLSKLKKLKRIGIIGGFVTLILLIAGYILVPLANVTIKLAAEKKKVDIAFIVDKNYTAVDTGALTIPGREISEDKETADKYPATGKKKVGEKATGTVTISNKYSTTPQSIVAGTRVVTAAGLVFKTNTNVTAPGYTKPGADIIAGTATVEATANDVGDTYNVAHPTHFTIPAADPTIYADTTAAFTGGTSRDVTYVTQADINKAKEEAAKSAESELKRLVLEKTDRDERLLDKAVKVTQISAEPSVQVNGEAEEFTLTVKSNIKALVFKEEDLSKLAENSLAEQIGSTKEIVEKESLLSSTEFTDADFDKGIMHARLAGEAFIATKLEQDKIKVDLSGEGEKKALEYLKNIDGVDDAEIKFFPSFLKRVPRIKSHIYLKVSLSKVQE